MTGQEPIRRRRTLSRIYRTPLLLGLVSLFGLIAALIVDGPTDLLWVAAVAVPLAAIGWAVTRSQRQPSP
jgi:hypothetical protein